MALNTRLDGSYYAQWLERQARKHGAQWDPSSLAPQFIPYLHSDQRIKVDGPYGVRFGTVGVTTGWRPVFLLMHRSSAHGSSDVLGQADQVVAEQRGGRYVPISTVPSTDGVLRTSGTERQP